MTHIPLTPRQRELWAWLEPRLRAGCPPTYDEMQAALGVKRKALHERITALVARGLIVRAPAVARGLALPPPTLCRRSARAIETSLQPETTDA
ncbi:MAG: hypothetical protein RQ833_07395 [Sphingomonadaceae bacterium]|nr:hypothetical protein [Sphingomonadaceae bacterium]